MSDQLLLVFDGTTAARFEEFHRRNPTVYRTLVRLAREWVNSTGRNKVGIGALYEVARWQIAIDTNDPDYKINNDFRAYYSRLIMAQEPDLADLFELRRSKADQFFEGQVAS